MLRAAAIACLPWLGLLLAAAVALRLLMWACGARPRFARLSELHADQVGGAQSLSFVLATPVFVMVMLLIVQVSQIMIGVLIVHQAAYAAARSAAVWIPAWVGDGEGQNEVHTLGAADYQAGHPVRTLSAGDAKYRKIEEAAWLAVMPAAPSHSAGGDQAGDTLTENLVRAYQAFVPDSKSNSRVAARLANKLAYAQNHTQLTIKITGPADEMEFLRTVDENQQPIYIPITDTDQTGWRDQVSVTLQHDYALLPGPARLLGRTATSDDVPTDKVASEIQQKNSYSVISLSATATLGIEGQRMLEVVPVAPRQGRAFQHNAE
ncbi:MAG TPA: TadE/TadG family type IV pilus assembly protein [Pirellulales bacterium]|jgi:hypothetical protein|nr:TadE/TadG family type IV pilus assembly protein [Pirellulales bacterium]